MQTPILPCQSLRRANRVIAFWRTARSLRAFLNGKDKLCIAALASSRIGRPAVAATKVQTSEPVSCILQHGC
jgi:hypothetical protein